VLGSQALAATGDGGPSGVAPHGFRQKRQRRRRRGRDRHVAGIAAHRIAREERVDTEVNDGRACGRLLERRVPGHVGLDDQDGVGLGERGVRRARLVVAQMEVVGVGKVRIDRIRLDHPDPARLRQLDQAGERAGIETRRRDQDHRGFGTGQDARRLVDSRGIGEPHAAELTPRR